VDFTLNEEQQMLADSVSRWLDAHYDFEARRRLLQSGELSARNWAQLADLGLLGLNVPQDEGGLGGTPVETLIAMQAFGRALLVEPFVETAVEAASLLARAGSAQQRRTFLPQLVEGSRRFALASLEAESRFDLADIRSTAVARGSGFVLDGRKSIVLHGDTAHALIVAARTSGDVREQEGITLFLVDAGASGMTIRGFPTFDGRRAAEVSLSGVTVGSDAVIGDVGGGYELLEWTVDRGIAALCAEGVGAMEKLMELTAEHLRSRRQFGQPIGNFQALQHRAADMLIAIEQARSMALLAAARVDDPDGDTRRKALSAAKFTVGRSGRFVGQQAVQLHGGMGMTDEMPVGHYFKRLTAIDITWGNVEHHLELYGDLL
jgi:alkylation response protein AidB-like acyl-CoA dehydrogenase